MGDHIRSVVHWRDRVSSEESRVESRENAIQRLETEVEAVRVQQAGVLREEREMADTQLRTSGANTRAGKITLEDLRTCISAYHKHLGEEHAREVTNLVDTENRS